MISRPRAVIAATLFAGFAATLAFNLPGQLSYDSIQQLHDGRFGTYHSWHPPVMSWLLGLGDALWPGTALFVIFNAALLFGALLLLLRLAGKPSLAAAAVAALAAVTPQLLLYEGIVWKDVLFANACVAGFACLASAAARWPRGRGRSAWLAAGFALLTLAAMTRQNGFMVLVVGSTAVAIIARRAGGSWRNAIVYGAAGFFLSAAVAAGATITLAARGDQGDGARDELKLLQTYDLVGALKADPGLNLRGLDDPQFERLLRTDGVRLYTPTRNDTLLQGSPALWTALSSAPGGAIFAAWWGLVEDHPGLYLKTRADIFRWVFLTPDITKCLPIYTGIDSEPPDQLRDLGITARERPQDVVLHRYAAAYLSTPVYSHPAFALAALCALFVLFRRRRPADLAVGFMLVAAFGFTASFFFVAIACDYRYLYFLDLSTLVALFYLALDFRKGGRGSSSPAYFGEDPDRALTARAGPGH